MTLSREQIASAFEEHGSIRRVGQALDVSEHVIRKRIHESEWLREAVEDAKFLYRQADKNARAVEPRPARQATAFEVDHAGGVATATLPATFDQSTVDELIRENGLDPADWIIVSTTLNRWNGLGKADKDGKNPKHTLRQVKVTLRPRAILDALFKPAALPPLTDLPKPRSFNPTTGSLGVLTGCWQYPYHDETFEGLFERFLADVRPNFGIDHGDGLDFASISRHADDPATDDPAQASVDTYGLALYRRRKVSPDTAWRLLFGNHDIRLLTEALQRSERLASVRPALWPGEEEQLPLISIERALRTEELGIEAVAPPFGSSKYAAAECVVSPRYIAIHGVKTDSKSAARQTVETYGCSISMAHTHRQRLFSVRLQRGPLPAVDATGVEVGCGMEIGGRGSLYATRPDWANGAMTVTLDDDGEPFFEPIRYREGVLSWRDYRWS